LAPAQGRQERGSAGAGLGYAGSAYGNQIAGGIEGQLAEYAPAQGRQERGSAGAGLGYAGSAYGNQIAGGIEGQFARALARFRKADYNKAIANQARQIRADQEKASKTTPQPQGSGPSDHLRGFRSLGY
jgi:hypothetical protein